MVTLENVARRFRSDEIDDLFDLLAKKKRAVHQYSWRHKKAVKFYSIHRFSDGKVLECSCSGPSTQDLRFSMSRDQHGYLFKMSVGELNEANVKTISKALNGLADRLIEREISGFNTSNWNGFYLWVAQPTDEVLPIFEQAVAEGYMTEEFKDLCLEWGVSIRKYPKN